MGSDRGMSSAAEWIRGARAAWRGLTGGADVADASRSTLVAVSGGADSAALAIALATLDAPRIVLGAVLHDLRPAELVHDDLSRLRQLATRFGIRLIADHVVAGPGNAEHAARRARYAALERMAADAGCLFIATGHHAHDQLETLLLAICRGASPEARLGIRPARAIGNRGVLLIRPLLELSPAGAHDVCREYGYRPRTDATNLDPARARGWLRRRVVPELASRWPNLGANLASAQAQLADRIGASPPAQGADIAL